MRSGLGTVSDLSYLHPFLDFTIVEDEVSISLHIMLVHKSLLNYSCHDNVMPCSIWLFGNLLNLRVKIVRYLSHLKIATKPNRACCAKGTS